MSNLVFKIKEIDQGFCRILYETKVSNEEKSYSVWYCIQEDFKDVCELYRCGLGPYFEPSHPVKFKEGIMVEVEVPKGQTQLENAVRAYIESNPQLIGV
jgi:hypothetical protein